MKHHIIVKWNDKVEDKDKFYQLAYEAFEKVTDIEGVSKLEIIRSNSDRKNRFDLMIIIYCDEDGLKSYDASLLHKEWKEKYSSYIENKAVFDCDET